MVEPLQKRTMTLNDLQMRALDVLRKVRFQLNRKGYEADGMSDAEFIDKVLSPFETDIYQDRNVLRMSRRDRRNRVAK